MGKEINIRETSFIEGPRDAEGRSWNVVLIEGGFNHSKQRFYTEDALRSVAELANRDGLHCMVDHPSAQESRDRPEGSILRIVGWYSDVQYDEAKNRVTGSLNMLTEGSPFPHLSKALKEAYDRGYGNLYELSIRGAAMPKVAVVEGTKTNVIGALTRLPSTDLVTRGGAGGRILNILEGRVDDMGLKEILADSSTEELAEALQESHPELATQITKDGQSKETKEIMGKGTEETKNDEAEEEVTEVKAESTKSVDAIAEARQLVDDAHKERFTWQAEKKLDTVENSLPKGVVTRLHSRVESGTITDMETLEESINEEIDIYKDLVPKTTVPAMRSFVVDTKDENSVPGTNETMLKAMIGLISGTRTYEGVKSFLNLKEAYWNYMQTKGTPLSAASMFNGWDIAHAILAEARKEPFDPLTMDDNLNEALANGEYEILESVTSATFTTLLGVSMHKVFIDAYATTEKRFGDYRRIISDFVSVSDFKTHNWSRRGVYNSLPSVGQGGTYQSLTTPGEENVTLAVVKYGGTEDLTMESIANDDLNALKSIPRDLALAATVGRYRAVFDLFTANAGLGATLDYDTTALFDATHSNTGTSALSSDQLHTNWMTMKENTALSASEVTLFAEPKYMLVPSELMRLSGQMFSSEFEIEPGASGVMNPNPVKGLAEPIHVPYWTDADNWYLVADPTQFHTIAFATLQGHEDPQVLMQDDPTVGSVFTADKITFKARDIRDQDVLDHRSFYGEVV